MGNSFNPPQTRGLAARKACPGNVGTVEGVPPRDGGNATLRVAVLSANDGLVSNLSLVIGGAGAMLSQETLLLAGLADHATAVQRPALETNSNTSIESAIRTKIIPRGHRT
jgi:VIT1/CCC1 family predicted Fe2+/Mn2+ transporter